jgi:hypothetical protein
VGGSNGQGVLPFLPLNDLRSSQQQPIAPAGAALGGSN